MTSVYGKDNLSIFIRRGEQPFAPALVKKNGFSLLELLVSLAILTIISLTIFNILKATVDIWEKGTNKLDTITEGQISLPAIDSIRSATSITQVSLESDNNGYIQYLHPDGVTVNVFLNTGANQALFGGNSLPSNAIVQTASDGSDPEIVLNNVTGFTVITYAENIDYFRIASPNNMTIPEYDEISSLQLKIFKTENNQPIVIQRLISLLKTAIAGPGTLEYGDDYDGQVHFPFQAHLDFPGFSAANMAFLPDNLAAMEADGAHLITANLTVKIKNTGKYFSSIQDAIDAAVSGNEILVAETPGGYLENITMKPGVKLYGGYESYNWTRDIKTYETLITSVAGIGDKTIILRDDTVVDGFTIDGAGLVHGIYGNNADNILIQNCAITNADRPIELIQTSGKVVNNTVTANESSIIIFDNSGPIDVLRNRFFSLNTFQVENVIVRDSTNVNIRNNIIIDGYHCVLFNDTSAASFINNIVTATNHLGLFGDNSIVNVFNNVFYGNDIGIGENPVDPGVLTIQYNMFADNENGNTSGALMLDGTNYIDGTPPGTYTWGVTDPYFEDIITYVLKDTAPIIDLGQPGAIYNDVYTGGNPGKGASRNDIGLYGGPAAGRNGPGTVHVIPSGSGIAAIQTAIAAMWPGDSIVFEAGTYAISSTLTSRFNTALYGAVPDATILAISAAAGFNLVADTLFEGFTLQGSSNTALQMTGSSGIAIRNNLFLDFNNAVTLTDSQVTLNNNSFYQNSIPVNINGASSVVKLKHNLFVSANIGINVAGTVHSDYSYYQDVNTPHSSPLTSDNNPVIINPMDNPPVFWDITDGNYYLHPDSLAITPDVTTSINIGAFEFFLATGSITSPVITSNVSRAYKSVNVHLYGTPGNFPAMEGRHSIVEIQWEINGQLSPTSVVATVNTNASAVIPALLPATTITDTFQFITTVHAYRNGRTPYINKIILQH